MPSAEEVEGAQPEAGGDPQALGGKLECVHMSLIQSRSKSLQAMIIVATVLHVQIVIGDRRLRDHAESGHGNKKKIKPSEASDEAYWELMELLSGIHS
eukprot:1175192-Amphidinium_carterae.1